MICNPEMQICNPDCRFEGWARYCTRCWGPLVWRHTSGHNILYHVRGTKDESRVCMSKMLNAALAFPFDAFLVRNPQESSLRGAHMSIVIVDFTHHCLKDNEEAWDAKGVQRVASKHHFLALVFTIPRACAARPLSFSHICPFRTHFKQSEARMS